MINSDSPLAHPEANRFLARQPILDRKRSVIGYEILFRSGWANSFFGDGDNATRQTLDNLLVAGVDSVCGRKLAFVNCTRESIVDGLITLLPVRSTVLEILETVEPDRELIAACRALRARGYRIALDDFVMRESMRELIALADFIKIDFRASDSAERRAICQALRTSHASLLAEKIENEAEFQEAISEGFTSFQGYFFCYPALVARNEVPPSHFNFLRLLCALSRSPLSFDELELIMKSDPALCYRLLRLANSSAHPNRGRMNVRNALMLIGEREIRKIGIVAFAASLGRHSGDALLHLSIQRARFCELVAPSLSLNPTEQYLIGLLSAADAFLALPMSTIVGRLPLPAAIRSALVKSDSPDARALQLARRFETGNWESSGIEESTAAVSHLTLSALYAESVSWAEAALAPFVPPQSGPIEHQRLCSCES